MLELITSPAGLYWNLTLGYLPSSWEDSLEEFLREHLLPVTSEGEGPCSIFQHGGSDSCYSGIMDHLCDF